MSPSSDPERPLKVLWLARLEHRINAWREMWARRAGRTPTVAAFPGYGGADWVRVLGRVVIPPRARERGAGEYAGVRGWRSFASVPIGFARVTITVDGATHEVVADRGGVIDTEIPATLTPGWQSLRMSVEGGNPVETRVFIVGRDTRFGVISDVDDTVMVTALPRPFLAAWNSFVINEHARQPVPGMSVLLERLVREHPGAPIVYLSTGAWNIAPTLARFLRRHLFPAGAMLLTDWGPTHDRWFRSGKIHKSENLERLANEFPDVKWLLIGDDGQHDDAIYTDFTSAHPDHVAGVAIRQLSPAEAVLAGGRTVVNNHAAAEVPWVTDGDGAGLLDKLQDLGLVEAPKH
ncbi:phosphatidate phosphatase APP1 [Microbacterium halimionae]|uniref:Phosphatidate phosphatase APP1 n=2 Tax=Microbacterium halimionae TaxID=1526413 RepID=A0A7W3JN97_9MICO|nr:phosphatase domain-containing protein [Microbacterium halimionae]MBA8815995.1 phosphatidate phosphatase APP1 [Microbacterium halimionae]NII96198.1 phosphatidate phosphatase APP1 [Microbacterium halimionae]